MLQLSFISGCCFLLCWVIFDFKVSCLFLINTRGIISVNEEMIWLNACHTAACRLIFCSSSPSTAPPKWNMAIISVTQSLEISFYFWVLKWDHILGADFFLSRWLVKYWTPRHNETGRFQQFLLKEKTDNVESQRGRALGAAIVPQRCVNCGECGNAAYNSSPSGCTKRSVVTSPRLCQTRCWCVSTVLMFAGQVEGGGGGQGRDVLWREDQLHRGTRRHV